MTNFLLALAIIVLAVVVYRPILRIAQKDIDARKAAGESNSVVYAILLLPLFGPFLYLLVRKRLVP